LYSIVVIDIRFRGTECGELQRKEFSDATMLEDRFRAWGLGTTGSLVEIEAVREIDSFDLIWNRSWLRRRRPVDGGVKGTVEPGHVRVFEP